MAACNRSSSSASIVSTRSTRAAVAGMSVIDSLLYLCMHKYNTPEAADSTHGLARHVGPRLSHSWKTVSAAASSPRTLQELLQAQITLYETFCVLCSQVAEMPGLPPVAGLPLPSRGIGQNKPVLPGVAGSVRVSV